MCTKNVLSFQQVLLKARSFAHEAGLPFLITEYKDGLQGGPGNATVHSGHHGDRSYAAAFVMRNIPLLTSLDMLSYTPEFIDSIDAAPSKTAADSARPRTP